MTDAPAAGLGDALRRTAATVMDSLCTRMELAVTELQEERLRLAQRALLASCALFCLGNGLVVSLLALAWWVGPAQGAWVLAAGGLVLLGAATLALHQWLGLAQKHPPLLHETLAQLRADTRALAGEP